VPLTLAIGELDADLTAIAALSPSNDDIIQRKAGAWTNRTVAQFAADLGLVAGVDYPTKATVTLSSADILDLHNTPITLVAAPGAGKELLFHRVRAWYSYGTTGYTSGGNVVSLAYKADASDVFATVGTLSGSVDRSYRSTEDGTHVGANVENQPIVAWADGALVDGDGTLTVTVWYSIEDVPA
jgi:hypothetical protein